MKRNEDEFALLLEGVNGIEAGMAKSLLAAEGIPCLVQGPDFDVAELGRAVHDMARGTNLFVPRQALVRAQRILDAAAWTQEEPESGGPA